LQKQAEGSHVAHRFSSTGIVINVKLILQLHKKWNKKINQTNNKISGIRHENDRQSDYLNNKVTKMN
jgi:hypothetical protein